MGDHTGDTVHVMLAGTEDLTKVLKTRPTDAPARWLPAEWTGDTVIHRVSRGFGGSGVGGPGSNRDGLDPGSTVLSFRG